MNLFFVASAKKNLFDVALAKSNDPTGNCLPEGDLPLVENLVMTSRGTMSNSLTLIFNKLKRLLGLLDFQVMYGHQIIIGHENKSITAYFKAHQNAVSNTILVVD